VSGAINQQVRVGDRIEVQAPSGSFLLPLRNEFPVVLIAGGIGITPFLSYLESLTGAMGEPQVTLFYASRDGKSQVFADRLRELAERLPNLTLITCFSRPAAGDVCDRRGRIGSHSIDQALIQARARFYMCAGDAMMAEIGAGLKARGVPAFEIFQERFRSPALPETGGDSSHEVRFTRSGVTLRWEGRDGPLLQFAERRGLSIPSGCCVGQCESCAVRVVSGQVRHAIDPLDLEEDHCLTCQAVPLSDLVLDA